MRTRNLFFVAVLSLALTGAGCLPTNLQPPASSPAYVTYSDSATGISFDVPATATLHNGVNGLDDMWKFEYNGNSYLVSFNQFKDGSGMYAAWDDAQPAKAVQIEKLADRTIYSLFGVASTEVFFTSNTPVTSIRVDKQTGTALHGEPTSNNDAVFAHLVASVKIKDEAAFYLLPR